MTNFPLVILAAGSSSRMGTSKALLPWMKSTLVKELVDKYLQLNQDVIVVSGSNYKALLNLHLQTSYYRKYKLRTRHG